MKSRRCQPALYHNPVSKRELISSWAGVGRERGFTAEELWISVVGEQNSTSDFGGSFIITSVVDGSVSDDLSISLISLPPVNSESLESVFTKGIIIAWFNFDWLGSPPRARALSWMWSQIPFQGYDSRYTDLLPTTLGPRTTFSFTGNGRSYVRFHVADCEIYFDDCKRVETSETIWGKQSLKSIRVGCQIRSVENTRYCRFL